jgi:hypothetical protein
VGPSIVSCELLLALSGRLLSSAGGVAGLKVNTYVLSLYFSPPFFPLIYKQADTLIRYLVDTLASYESDHSDALCPIQREADRSFNGDHVLAAPTTAAETRELKKSIDAQFQSVVTIMTLFITQAMTGGAAAMTPTAAFPNTLAAAQSAPRGLSGPPTPTFSSNHSQPPAIALPPIPRQTEPQHATQVPQAMPIPGLRIPNLPQGKDAWRVAVTQWRKSTRRLESPSKTGLLSGTPAR